MMDSAVDQIVIFSNFLSKSYNHGIISLGQTRT